MNRFELPTRTRAARLFLSGCVLAVSLVPALSTARENVFPWLDLDAEYRVETLYINPLELNGLSATDINFTEQRFRLETGLKPVEQVAIRGQFDLLSGVLFGDNGDLGGTQGAGSPTPSSGLALTSRWPNNSSYEVGLLPGGDPLDPDSYGMVLRQVDPIRINRLYGEALLPFGLLRVGRQPSTSGPGINLHDGSRSNRWGVSRYSPTADRFLFATKISELFRLVAEGDEYVPDRSMENGVILGGAFDLVVEDDVSYGGDDLMQGVGLIQWKVAEPTAFGWKWHPFLVQAVLGGRFGDEFDTQVFAIPVTLEWGVGPVHFLGEFVTLFGHTREISEGMAALRESDEAKRVVYDQDILAFAARAVLDVEMGPVTGTLEFDYASGDSDPRDETTLTTFNWDRDANVGLLLFEHVLAFETARSAAVGYENLRHVGSDSFPLTELASDGRFHNAICAFPQVLYRPWKPLGIRAGALFAWADAPVTDPIMTLLSEDGVEISDDAVNWNGGKPARYYGTELDLQIEWAFKEFFLWTVEGAVLFPGDALRDESGDAVNSFLVENRFTFLF